MRLNSATKHGTSLNIDDVCMQRLKSFYVVFIFWHFFVNFYPKIVLHLCRKQEQTASWVRELIITNTALKVVRNVSRHPDNRQKESLSGLSSEITNDTALSWRLSDKFCSFARCTYTHTHKAASSESRGTQLNRVETWKSPVGTHRRLGYNYRGTVVSLFMIWSARRDVTAQEKNNNKHDSAAATASSPGDVCQHCL